MTNGLATVVAIPARDEADRIGACLRALANQLDDDGRPLARGSVKMVVLANNCRDDTAAVARATNPAVEVVEVELTPEHANAGAARRAAMEAAAARLPGGAGLICTTDADSRARPDWIAKLWKAVADGAEAVAGAVEFDPLERRGFSAMRRLEAVYSGLQAEILARVDPEAHNPWPNHIWAWGANLAVTTSAYRRVGGIFPQALGEDRAFVERLRYHDVPVRHCLDARVWTSARTQGRAPGGLASLVRDHVADDVAPCDAALQPARLVFRRATWRARLRRAFEGGLQTVDWSHRLCVAQRVVKEALAAPTFGAGWAHLEAQSPRLAARRLFTHELEAEIAMAERFLARLRPDAPADPADIARASSAGLWSTPAPSPPETSPPPLRP